MSVPEGIVLREIKDGKNDVPDGVTLRVDPAEPFEQTTKVIIKSLNTAVPGLGTALDTARVFTSAIGGEVVAGLAGLPQLAAGDISGSASTIENVRDTFRIAPVDDVQGYLGPNPLTPDTGEVLKDVGGIMEPIVKTTEGALGAVLPGVTAKDAYNKGLGEATFESTGSPAYATFSGMLVDLLGYAGPTKGNVSRVRSLGKAPTKLNRAQKEARQLLIDFIDQDQSTLKEVSDRMNSLGAEALIVDVAGANTSQAGRLTGLATREGREAVKENIGTIKAPETLRKPSHANAETDTAYRNLYERRDPLKVTDEMGEVLSRPLIQDGLKATRDKIAKSEILSPENRKLGLEMLREVDGKVEIDYNNINAVGLDYIKRTLSDKKADLSNVSIEKVNNADVASYTALTKRLIDETDNMLATADTGVSYSQTLGTAQRAQKAKGQLNETAQKFQASDAQIIALQDAVKGKVNKRKLGEAVSEVGTDVLFAITQNRFAVLRLIDRAFSRTNKVRQDTINELGNLLLSDDGAKAFSVLQDEANTIMKYNGGAPVNMEKAFKAGPRAAFNWLRNKSNRRLFLEQAAVASLLMAKENEQDTTEDK